jgi:hypothetical protein
MTWFGWVLVADLLLSLLYYISLVGKPRVRTTKDAVCTTIEVGLMVAGILAIGTGHLH